MSDDKVKLAEEIIDRDLTKTENVKKWKPKKDFDMKAYVDRKLDEAFVQTQASNKHSHATHSGDAFCPGCGDKNPDFNGDQLECVDCGKTVGSKKEVEDGTVKFCRNCGGNKAKEKVAKE